MTEAQRRVWDAEDENFSRLVAVLDQHRSRGEAIVTTNGCFNLLHVGHLRVLESAAGLGHILVVGLNSDRSVRHLKGRGRPILSQDHRAAILAGLRCVDHVVVFHDSTPMEFLSRIRPHIHCKGGDYRADELPETQVVVAAGGRVEIIPIEETVSTSKIVEQIRSEEEAV